MTEEQMLCAGCMEPIGAGIVVCRECGNSDFIPEFINPIELIEPAPVLEPKPEDESSSV